MLSQMPTILLNPLREERMFKDQHRAFQLLDDLVYYVGFAISRQIKDVEEDE